MSSLFDNWTETKKSLLQGLSSEKQGILDTLLENQKNHFDNDKVYSNEIKEHEATTRAREIDEYNTLKEMHQTMPDLFSEIMKDRFNQLAGKYGFGLIAMLKKIIPNTIANDICGVQPMTGPSGLIFTIKAKYTDKDPSLEVTNN